jgi:Tol biopolymer transport system component
MRAGTTVAPKKSSLAVSTRGDHSARLSPDGKRIVFASNRSGATELWLCDSTGRNSVQLTNHGAVSGSPRWSPDGERIAFDFIVDGRFEIYVMNANGGGRRRLTNAGGAIPAWSRDGKWIYFVSQASGDRDVWKIPLAGGEPIRVTRNGGLMAMESPDGKFLYYPKGGQATGLWRAPISGGEEARILDAVAGRAFDVVEDGIYFMAPGGPGTLIQFYSFATKKTTLIDTIEKPVYLYLDVSPDRRSILYTQHDQQVEDLMLVENFR